MIRYVTQNLAGKFNLLTVTVILITAIGSAFFEGKFVPGGDFTQNIKAVSDWLANTAESEVTKYL